MAQTKSRSAAVTGAGSGLGRDIALGLAAKSYRVFGTAISEHEVSELREASGGAVTLTLCDITNEAAVKQWAQLVATETSGGLDLLINNAGILTPGPLEMLPLAAIRREFDVNVFGSLSVINAFLPALRKSRGRIVQISTWTASVPLPFNGPSGASKAAIEVLATVYRAELMNFGVDVVIVAPGNMRTGGPAKTAAALTRVADSMTADQRALYGQTFETFANTLNSMQNSGLDSSTAAAKVIEIAEQMPAPSRAAVGADAEEMLRVAREKSDAEQDALRLHLVGLAPKAADPHSPLQQKDSNMIELVDPKDSRAVRNKNSVLTLYDLMINKKRSKEATAKFVSPAYIQHNPIIPDGSDALGEFFGKVTMERANARVVVHKIIAIGDFVWAHVNFLNLFNDDPKDTGIAGVDIYKFDADGMAIEHWDTLQFVGDPKNSAPLLGPDIPRANPNGMF